MTHKYQESVDIVHKVLDHAFVVFLHVIFCSGPTCEARLCLARSLQLERVMHGAREINRIQRACTLIVPSPAEVR